MKKLLLVDDEVFIYNFLNRFLEREYKKEYTIDYATNGQEGLSLFDKNNYDIIFTDFTMPVMNGYEMIREIRKSDKNIPIVLMTGSNGKKMEGIPVILKPFDLDEIKQVLQKI